MARWTPDPSFYPSPAPRHGGPEGGGGVRGAAQSGRLGRPSGRARRCSTSRRARPPTASSSAASTCPTPATSSTTSAGTRAAPRCAPGRRTRTSSAATSWCRACAPRASMWWTWARIPRAPIDREGDRAGGGDPQDRLLAAAHLALRPRGDLHERAGRSRERRRPGRDLPARLRELRPARAVGGRARAPALRLRLLVAPRLRHAPLERVGHARTCSRTGWCRRSCSAKEYGHQLHVWDLRRRATGRPSTSATSTRWCSSCAPPTTRGARDGFVGVVVSVADLSASVWRWSRRPDGSFEADKVITIPAVPKDPDELPPALKDFGAVPPLVTDINLSLDDRWLYVSCWGTGELLQYDVSDPAAPRLTGTVEHRRASPGALAHPASGPAERRAADGRGEPRRAPRVPDELALLVVGRAVLPGRRCRAGSRRSTPSPDGGIERGSRTSSSPTSTACVRTRCASRAATPRPTPTASRRSRPWTRAPCWRWPRLGAVHGVNPAMGWLFAVAIGLQERSRRALAAVARPDRDRPRGLGRADRAGHRDHRLGGRAAGGGHRRRRDPDRVRDLEAARLRAATRAGSAPG